MPIQSHDFRGTRITELINLHKLDPKTAQYYVGHKKVATTLGYLKIDQTQAMELVKATMIGKRIGSEGEK